MQGNSQESAVISWMIFSLLERTYTQLDVVFVLYFNLKTGNYLRWTSCIIDPENIKKWIGFISENVEDLFRTLQLKLFIVEKSRCAVVLPQR